jgi:stage II sporulation protein D
VKTIGAFFIILILLPYVFAVFVNGSEMEGIGKTGNNYVQVRQVGADGTEQVFKVAWVDYFIGVLAKDISESYEEETLKAQAVLVRTNLYRSLNASSDFVLEESYLSTEDLEKKWDAKYFDSYYERLKQAMEDTENQVLYYEDTYAMVPFHQSSNGMTRSGLEVLGDLYPYLQSVECTSDKEATDEMHIYQFEYSEIQSKCQSFLVAVSEEDANKTYTFSDFAIVEYDSAGYVTKMKIGDTVCTGDQFRDALSLASSAFTLQDYNGMLRITTVGKGHGLGMSQWTANELAKEGKSYEEILDVFFTGTKLIEETEILLKTE